ncbi:MAG: preprotein translocase subunit SecG [Cyclobacteriaceae bacterium]
MLTLVISLTLILSVLLILVVLMQNTKGGLGAVSGSSATSQLVGVKKASDFLEKTTWVLIVAIFLLSVGANAILQKDVIDPEESAIGIDVEAPVSSQPLAPTTSPSEENGDALFQEENKTTK